MKREEPSPESPEIEGAEENGDVDAARRQALVPYGRRSLRRAVLGWKVEVARQRAADAVEMLLERVFYACYDWMVGDWEPEQDQELVQRSVRRGMAAMVHAFRRELARRGLSVRELNVWLGWPEGRAEEVFAEPSELMHDEALLLCEALRIPMADLFEAERSGDS